MNCRQDDSLRCDSHQNTEDKKRPKLIRQQTAQLDVPKIKEQYRIRSLSDTVTINADEARKTERILQHIQQEQMTPQLPLLLQPSNKSPLHKTSKHGSLGSKGGFSSDMVLHSCLTTSTNGDLAASRIRSVTFADDSFDELNFIDDSLNKSPETFQSRLTLDDSFPNLLDDLNEPEQVTSENKSNRNGNGNFTDDAIDSQQKSIPNDCEVRQTSASQQEFRQDSLSIYSLVMEKDFRYYFQHPYVRLFITYFVIFCNFLIFAEDPVSHSHTESVIPGLGNIFSFVVTKYPADWKWSFVKAFMWTTAMLFGMVFGKIVIHRMVFGRWFRLKMFRDDQGTWMIMFLTVLLFLFIFSHIYNLLLQIFEHPQYRDYKITMNMGITNASFMKAAACGTWLGDLVTAWMVTDMMLQDNLYPDWARGLRNFWKTHGKFRIILFWASNLTMTTLVVYFIISDLITWDKLNRDFVATTEISRAFLASFILVMDLLIVMQDWDFPHFVCDMDIKLPGLTTSIVSLEIWKCADTKDCLIHITGKWFNYGIIFLVMMLDLNMWKNQIFYSPPEYGQYTDGDHKIHTVADQQVLATDNSTLWSYDWRYSQKNHVTNSSYLSEDMVMNSRYMGHSIYAKLLCFIPSIVGFIMFGSLIYMYGRFRPKCDKTLGGRLKKSRKDLNSRQSSWNKERSKKFLPPAMLSCARITNYKNRSEWNMAETATPEVSEISVKQSDEQASSERHQCETFL